MSRRRKTSKKKKLTTCITVSILLTAVIFTLCMIWLFYKFQSVPDSLIVAFFGAVFGELSICGMIRTAKVKAENKLEGQ